MTPGRRGAPRRTLHECRTAVLSGTRIRAIVLGILFFAGNFGLPEADVLLDHTGGAPHAVPQVHLERTGGCPDHDSHCALGHLLAESRVQAPAPTSSHQTPASPRAGAYRHTPTLSLRAARGPHHARDPPPPPA